MYTGLQNDSRAVEIIHSSFRHYITHCHSVSALIYLWICEVSSQLCWYLDGIGFSELDESVTVLVSQCGCLSNSVSASPWVIWPVIPWIMCSSSDKRHPKHCLQAIQIQTQMLQVCMYSPEPCVSFHPRLSVFWESLCDSGIKAALDYKVSVREFQASVALVLLMHYHSWCLFNCSSASGKQPSKHTQTHNRVHTGTYISKCTERVSVLNYITLLECPWLPQIENHENEKPEQWCMISGMALLKH